MYIKKIINLTEDNWKAIFEALYKLQESRAYNTQVEVGAVAEDHEALLSNEPPSPVPM